MDIHALSLLARVPVASLYIILDDHAFLQLEVLERLKSHLPGTRILLDAQQDKSELLLALQSDSLFAEPQHVFVQLDKKPQHLNSLLATCVQSNHPVVLYGGYIKNLIKTKDYSHCMQQHGSDIVVVQTANKGDGWFHKWLDWKAKHLQLKLAPTTHTFLVEELPDAPLIVSEWLSRCAFFARIEGGDEANVTEITADKLDSLSHYQQQQELRHLMHAILTGDSKRALARLDSLQQSGEQQLGLFLWLLTKMIYQLVALKTRDTKYNARFYAPVNAHTMQSLAHATPLSQLHVWLKQLLSVDMTRRTDSHSFWAMLCALLQDITKHSRAIAH